MSTDVMYYDIKDGKTFMSGKGIVTGWLTNQGKLGQGIIGEKGW